MGNRFQVSYDFNMVFPVVPVAPSMGHLEEPQLCGIHTHHPGDGGVHRKWGQPLTLE